MCRSGSFILPPPRPALETDPQVLQALEPEAAPCSSCLWGSGHSSSGASSLQARTMQPPHLVAVAPPPESGYCCCCCCCCCCWCQHLGRRAGCAAPAQDTTRGRWRSGMHCSDAGGSLFCWQGRPNLWLVPNSGKHPTLALPPHLIHLLLLLPATIEYGRLVLRKWQGGWRCGCRYECGCGCGGSQPLMPAEGVCPVGHLVSCLPLLGYDYWVNHWSGVRLTVHLSSRPTFGQSWLPPS